MTRQVRTDIRGASDAIAKTAASRRYHPRRLPPLRHIAAPRRSESRADSGAIGSRGQAGQGRAAYAAQLPFGEQAGAERAIELLRVHVPVEDHPLEAAAAALDRERRQPFEERAADAAAARVGTDEQIFEIERRPGEEGLVGRKKERVGDELARARGDQKLEARRRGGEVGGQPAGRLLVGAGQFFVNGQGADEREHLGQIVRGGGADLDSRRR